MASLVDPVSEDVRALLCQIADPWTKSRRWPVWQYVRGCLDEAGIDADRVWREMPTWDRNYRAAQALDSFGSQTPLDEQRVALSVHGWVHSGHESSGYVIRQFLSAIQLGHQAQRSAPLDPDHVRDVQLDGPRLFAQADQALDGKPTGGRDVLPHVLSMEPPTWGSLSVSREADSSFSDAWTWGVTRLRLEPFAQSKTGWDYLATLQEQVAAPSRATIRASDPLTLPRALDHIDVVWQLTHDGQHLVQLRKANVVAELALGANSGEEFQARLSALADVLLAFDVQAEGKSDRRKRSLTVLCERLASCLESDQVALREMGEQVDQLNAIVDVRHGQQHSDSAITRAADAAARLGVSTSSGDWETAWEQVRGVAAQSLLTLANHVEQSWATSLPVRAAETSS